MFDAAPYEGPRRECNDVRAAKARKRAAQLDAAQTDFDVAIEHAFAPGTFVHVRTGDYVTRVIVTQVSRSAVFVLNEATMRAYWVSVHRLREMSE